MGYWVRINSGFLLLFFFLSREKKTWDLEGHTMLGEVLVLLILLLFLFLLSIGGTVVKDPFYYFFPPLVRSFKA